MKTEDELRRRIDRLRVREALLHGGKDWETKRERTVVRQAMENERQLLEWVLEDPEPSQTKESVRVRALRWALGR